MTTYTVLAPRDPARTQFVPDRFSRAAFIFGPLWLLWHRVWRGLIGYATVLVLVTWATRWFQLPPAALSITLALLALFLGFEGPALRRAALERRGFRLADIVVSPNREHAESVFFERWRDEPEAPPAPPPARGAARTPDVLGLFPEAGGRR